MKIYKRIKDLYNNNLYISFAHGEKICSVDKGDVVFLLEVEEEFGDSKVYYPTKGEIGWITAGGIFNSDWELLNDS